MRVLAFRLEYDGSAFAGYQRQRAEAGPTVQGTLEAILGEVLAEPVQAICAGRTDAGVHAIGQIVHVATASGRSLDVVVRALNRKAHGRLGVRAAWEAPWWFHARHAASRRVYQYHVLAQAAPRPLLGRVAWHVPLPVDAALLNSEAAGLTGRRDFRAFAPGAHDLRHFFRTIHRAEWFPVEHARTASRSWLAREGAAARLLALEIEADAFLPHMVRMLVATMVEVASGRRPPGTLASVLRGRDPAASAAPAPPQGLCLVDVRYPAECMVPPPAA